MRGHRLVRHADLQSLRQGPAVGFDVRNLLQLSPQEAPTSCSPVHPWAAPTQPGPATGSFLGVQTQTLARHLLDDSGPSGLLGSPDADVFSPTATSRCRRDPRVIRQIFRPSTTTARSNAWSGSCGRTVLVYRILMLVNSTAYMHHEIGSLRHALMILGFRELGRWLDSAQQRTDNDLQTVRAAMVMRARLARRLLATGSEDNLRLEVYTTALFAHLDELLHAPLAELLHELPLSRRLYDAVLRHDEPYHPLLDVARARVNPTSCTA